MTIQTISVTRITVGVPECTEFKFASDGIDDVYLLSVILKHMRLCNDNYMKFGSFSSGDSMKIERARSNTSWNQGMRQKVFFSPFRIKTVQSVVQTDAYPEFFKSIRG